MRADIRASVPQGRAVPGASRGSSAQPRLSCTAMWALGPLVPIAALAAAASSAPASAQTRTTDNVFMSENEGGRRFQEETGYSDAVVAGGTIYLSGVVVGLREGEDLRAAYDRTYRQIGAILARAGASWDDVVDITSYHTDVTAQFDAMVAVHRRYVRAPFPAWTAIDVDRLIPAAGLTEIKIVARRPERARRGGGARR